MALSELKATVSPEFDSVANSIDQKQSAPKDDQRI